MIAPQTLLQNRYLVIKQIGQGGMGAVYLATDQRFGSTVALKETFFTDATLRKAFEREARLLNRLRHPALPNVSDHFLEDEGQFLVMEFITGEDLSEMLKEQGGAFPIKEVLGWGDQLLDALDYLHTQDSPVIHRDIKPQNLKLTPRGQIILLDFGLAKGTPLQVSQVTASGSVFGYSRNYAPIEQIQGTGTDTRSDLYSLAATLYHLMTGVTPPDALTRATSVLNGQPDPLRPANEVHGQITPAVAQVLMRAMSQNAGQRPQTAASMRVALSEAGKQTLVAGNVTNAQAIAAGTLLEQDTQLMGTTPVEARTSAKGANEQRAAVRESQQATSAEAGHVTAKGEPASATSIENPESEVTQVTPALPARRSISGRAAGLAAGGFVLLLVAAVVFAMSRRPATEPASTSTPTEISNPSSNNSQTNQSSANQNATTGNALPGETQRRSTLKSEPSARTSKGTTAPASSKEQPTVPSTPTPPGRNTQANSTNARDARHPEYANMTDEQIAEERRKARAEKQRAAAERHRAERERRQAEELRRRQLDGRP